MSRGPADFLGAFAAALLVSTAVLLPVAAFLGVVRLIVWLVVG